MTSHRGLPPPAAMIPLTPQQPSNILENMPHQWQNSEDMARNWVQLRIEEIRLKAEEERTKQVQSRLDIRKLEVDIRKLELGLLEEAHRIGIPPLVIPIMFAGGGALKGLGGEWLNEYYTQHMGNLQQQMAQQLVQQQQQQQQQVHPMSQHHHSPGPDRKLRREPRVIGDPFGPHGPPVQPHMGPPPGAAVMPPQQGPPPAGYMPPYPLSGMPAAPRSGPPTQQPPRPPQINTKDMHPHQPQQPQILPGQMITPIGTPHGQIQQVPPQSAQPAQETAIFFHHYVPPNTQSASMSTPVKSTASPQTQLQSPFTHHPPSNQLTGPDYVSSPKKRKHANASSSQQQTPSTPFSPQFNATPLSTATTTPSRPRRAHSRHRSDTGSSGRGFESYPRHRQSTGESPLPETNMSGPQLPPVTSAGDSVSGNGGGNGGPHHPREQEHQRQEQQRQEDQRQDQQRQQRHEQQRQDQQQPQSVPPPPPQQIGGPYSAGPDFRGGPYPPPHPPPPSSDGGRDSKSGNGRN